MLERIMLHFNALAYFALCFWLVICIFYNKNHMLAKPLRLETSLATLTLCWRPGCCLLFMLKSFFNGWSEVLTV